MIYSIKVITPYHIDKEIEVQIFLRIVGGKLIYYCKVMYNILSIDNIIKITTV